MLFNSTIFIFWFLPLVLLGFFSISRYNHKMAAGWLILAAFFFYGYWNPKFLLLLIFSITINYSFGLGLTYYKAKNQPNQTKLLFIFAIIINLGILFYFKYSNFFLSQVNTLTGKHYLIKDLILPLGISFFTFTQIAFLADVYQKKCQEYSALYYFLFVTYFPHLIAGPIIHHAEMMPQFLAADTYKFNKNNFTIGLLIFIIGLSKKILIADHLALYADEIFNAVTNHTALTLIQYWGGALSYTFQLYFDFSGYCDMAIGLSLMFNIKLPINFNSPYKSLSIIDFWRRWHITLSRYLRDYLYIPLGGNRKGTYSRYHNLLLTMLLGGLWHGASWTFIAWGALHGSYLVINHLWRSFMKAFGFTNITNFKLYKFLAWAVTFFAVVIAWVFFRANSFASALEIIQGMLGKNGFTITSTLIQSHFYFVIGIVTIGIICFLLPNTQQIFAQYKPGLETYPGDITPKSWLDKIDWLTFIQPKIPRFLAYTWVAYTVSILSMVLFYYTDIDAKIFQHFPTHMRPTDGVDIKQGDYRSNLFVNNIFLGTERKVIIVGSSYTMDTGSYYFNVNGIAYKSGTIGNGGNTLANGFRAALVTLQNFKVDTIIFGVTPLGFGNIFTPPSIFFADQCVNSFNLIGTNTALNPFHECTPLPFKIKNILALTLIPEDKRFFQFDGFLNKMLAFSSQPTPVEQPKQFSLTTLTQLDHWYDSIKEQAKNNPSLPDINNGTEKTYHWHNRKILESLEKNGDVYLAFQKLKSLADSKGVHLVVYNSPTPDYSAAPYIYPQDFLPTYRTKLAEDMKSLGITYFDFGDEMIWDNHYALDFVHLTSQARERIHAMLIYNLFFGGKRHEIS